MKRSGLRPATRNRNKRHELVTPRCPDLAVIRGMNDTLATFAPTVSVSPGTQPWWAVRRSLIVVLVFLVALWVPMNVQRERVDRWMVSDLPVNDTIALRLAGY
jgi:hypothetical protein